MGDCRYITPRTKTRMDSSGLQMEYGCNKYNWNNVFKPKEYKELYTRMDIWIKWCYCFNDDPINIPGPEEWHYICIMSGSERYFFYNKKVKEFPKNLNKNILEVRNVVRRLLFINDLNYGNYQHLNNKGRTSTDFFKLGCYFFNNDPINIPGPEEWHYICITRGSEKYFFYNKKVKEYPKNLNKNILEVRNVVRRLLFINDPKYGNDQRLNNKGRTSTDFFKLGLRVGSSVYTWLFFVLALSMLQPASAYPITTPLQKCQHVKLNITYSNNHISCTLTTANGYSLHYSDLNSTFCEELKKHMKIILISLSKSHNVSSGTLQLIVCWELNKDLEVLAVKQVLYIFNGRHLTTDEIGKFPEVCYDSQRQDQNLSSEEVEKKIFLHFTQLWERLKEELRPFLQRSDTTGSPNEKSKSELVVRKPWGVLAAVAIVVVVIARP